MSIKVMTLVWEFGQVKGSKLLLLLAIADNSNEDRVCWPGIKYLASKIRMSERTVQRLIRELDIDQEIAIEYGAGRGKSHLYHVLTGLGSVEKKIIKKEVDNFNKSSGLNLAPLKGDKLAPSDNNIKGDKLVLKGDKIAGKGDIAVSPESLIINQQVILKNNTRSKYYKFWGMIIEQLSMEYKHPDNSPVFKMIRDNIAFIDYKPKNNTLELIAVNGASEYFKSRFNTTVSRMFQGLCGTKSPPKINIEVTK